MKYVARRIAIYRFNTPYGISGGFSGCYMAAFRYNDNRYIAHIACDGTDDAKTAWNALVESRVFTDVILFKPTENYVSASSTGIWGLIDNSNSCYRLEVLEKRKKQWEKTKYIFDCTIDEGLPLVNQIRAVDGGMIPVERAGCILPNSSN